MGASIVVMKMHRGSMIMAAVREPAKHQQQKIVAYNVKEQKVVACAMTVMREKNR